MHGLYHFSFVFASNAFRQGMKRFTLRSSCVTSLLIQGRIQVGGGVLGVSPNPFRGPPNFIKREKKTVRAGARMEHVLVVNSYPPPPPFPKSCILPLHPTLPLRPEKLLTLGLQGLCVKLQNKRIDRYIYSIS